MLNIKWNMFWIVGVALIIGTVSHVAAEDFSVTFGNFDEVSRNNPYDAGNATVQFKDTESRWMWNLEFLQPGTYTVSAKVAVASANAGSTLRIGNWVPQHGDSSSYTETVVTATDPTANVNPQWQMIGQIKIAKYGPCYVFAQIVNFIGEDPGLLHAIRLEGPGVINTLPIYKYRHRAVDIKFEPTAPPRRACYAEMVSRPWPIPAIRGTHTVVNTGSGYVGNNGDVFQSLWQSNGIYPTPLVSNGSADTFDHEGSGGRIGLEDKFYLDPTRRRKMLNISVPDGNGNTLTTLLIGEVGHRWHLVGRRRQYAADKNAGSSGFLENFSVFNAHLHRRSCAWGNIWAYEDSNDDGSNEWRANTTIVPGLRSNGVSPAEPPSEGGVFVYGTHRLRQDMVEMIGGGMIIAQGNTPYDNVPTSTPDLPMLNQAYALKNPEDVILAANAQAGIYYSSDLKSLINDPFSSLDFEYIKVSGPSWITVNNNGNMNGLPVAGNAGLNLAVIRATDTEAGLSGYFTVGVYVVNTGNNAPAFLDHPELVQTVPTLDDTVLDLSYIDPDSTNQHTFSITAGNGAGFFGFNGDQLIKIAAPTPGEYFLTIQVSDNGTPVLSDTLNVDVEVVASDGMGGATRYSWYLLSGNQITDLTNSPLYPNEPNEVSMVADLEDAITHKSTGHRVVGYLYPPTTGSYTFWMSGSEAGEMRLSTDQTAGNLELMCKYASKTNKYEWTKYTQQESAPVTLIAGQRYYFQVLTKTGGGNWGHFAVAWQRPGMSQQVVPGQYLSAVEYVTPSFGAETVALRDVLVGQAYQDNMLPKLASNHLHDSISYQKMSGPAWLNVSVDGVLTGTPGAGDTGSNAFVIRITTPGGHYDEATFTIDVQNNIAPQFNSDPVILSNIDEYTEIEGTLADYVTDVNIGDRLGFGDALSIAIVAGPDWLNIEPTGDVYGSPGVDDHGLNVFTIQATDLGGLTTQVEFQITVNDIEMTPQFTMDPITDMMFSGDSISGNLATFVFDPDTSEVLTFQKLSGPEWLTVDANGILSGSPGNLDIGINMFDIQVTDSTARTASGHLQVTVNSGQFLIYEGFDADPNDSINTRLTGIGWTGVWTGAEDFTINSSGLSFGSLPVTALSASNGTIYGDSCSRFLTQSIAVGATDGEYSEIWVSGLLNLSGTMPGQGIEVQLKNSGATQVAFGKKVNGPLGLNVRGNQYNATDSGGGTTGGAPTGTYLCVLHLANNAGDVDVTLYLDKNTGIDLSDPADFRYSVSQTFTGLLLFDNIGWWVNKADPQNVDLDELRIVRTYAQAVPINMTSAPTFNADPLAKCYGVIDVAYQQSLTSDVSDPDTGDVFGFTKISGPAWLNIAYSGMLSGTPTATDLGLNQFTVCVTDSAGNQVETRMEIDVYEEELKFIDLNAFALFSAHWLRTDCGNGSGGFIEPVSITASSTYSSSYSHNYLITGDMDGPITSSADTFKSNTYGSGITWLTANGAIPTPENPQWIKYDFGNNVQLSQLDLWNWARTLSSHDFERGIKDFTVSFSSDDMIYSGGTIFAAEMAISEMAESTQVFEFLPVTARYAKVAITSNHGHTSFAGISELHFEYTPVDCGGCDLDNDHDVDLDDLKILAQNWLSIN